MSAPRDERAYVKQAAAALDASPEELQRQREAMMASRRAAYLARALDEHVPPVAWHRPIRLFNWKGETSHLALMCAAGERIMARGR